MSQPLGDSVGNALDVIEAVEILRGERRGRLRDLALAFAATALERLSGVAPGEGLARAERALDAGEALESFRRMIEAQGGDARVVDEPEAVLPRAPVVRGLIADRTGTVAAVDAEAIGRASADLGAGRRRKGEQVDPAVGLVLRAKIGDRIARGEVVGQVHARDEASADAASAATLEALTLVEGEIERPDLIHAWIPA
jgi:thymidine phosphorylase